MTKKLRVLFMAACLSLFAVAHIGMVLADPEPQDASGQTAKAAEAPPPPPPPSTMQIVIAILSSGWPWV